MAGSRSVHHPCMVHGSVEMRAGLITCGVEQVQQTAANSTLFESKHWDHCLKANIEIGIRIVISNRWLAVALPVCLLKGL